MSTNKVLQPKLSFWHPASLIATFLGVGKIPFAPGTWGSLAAYMPSSLLLVWLITTNDPLNIAIKALIALLILFIIGTIAAHIYAQKTENADPKEVVIDEVVGQLLTNYFTYPFAFLLLEKKIYSIHSHSVKSMLIIAILTAPFLLFRFFDIVKPWPANWCDKNIKGGLGIMLDDIVAAFMAITIFNAIIMILEQRI
jgi:phosphatidylglycerophosphatase A